MKEKASEYICPEQTVLRVIVGCIGCFFMHFFNNKRVIILTYIGNLAIL